MSTSTNIQNFIINKMTTEQFESLSTIDPNQIYVVTDAPVVITDNTLTGAGTEESPLGISSTITGELETLDTNLSDLGEQVQDIQGTLNTITPTFTLPQANTDPTVITFPNKIVMISGVASVGTVGAGTSSTVQVSLPSGITMANTVYIPQLTASSSDEFCDILCEAKAQTTTGFTIAYKNIDTNSASNVNVGWFIFSEIA